MCTRRYSFREFYNVLLFNFLENCFFPRHLTTPTTLTHTHDPRPMTHDPRPTTYDSGSHPDQVNPVEQVLIKPSLAIPDQPSPTSVGQVLIKPSRASPDQPSLASSRKPNLASLDQTQSSQSGSNPVQPVGIKPSQASPDQSSLPSPDQTQSNQSRSTQPKKSRSNPV